MKKTTKLVLMSVLTIAMCVSLIAGATFALFTDDDSVNIVVSSGKVDVEAKIDTESLMLYSLDEGVADAWKDSENFKTGGGATIDGNGDLSLDEMVPGDRAEFDIVVTNFSNVTIQYRASMTLVKDEGLFSGLKVSYGEKGSEVIFGGTAVYSTWEEIAAAAEGGETIATVHVIVELPESAGNGYQDTSCKLTFAVEAVQGNAQVFNGVARIGEKLYDTLPEAFDAVQEGETITLLHDIVVNEADLPNNNYVTFNGQRKGFSLWTFDGDGHTITSNLSANGITSLFHISFATNATIKNLNVAGEAYFAFYLQSNKPINLENVHISGKYLLAVNVYGDETANMKDCTIIDTYAGKYYGGSVWVGDSATLNLTNSHIDSIFVNSNTNSGAYGKVYMDTTSTIDTVGESEGVFIIDGAESVPKGAGAKVVTEDGEVYTHYLELALQLVESSGATTLTIVDEVEGGVNPFEIKSDLTIKGEKDADGNIGVINNAIFKVSDGASLTVKDVNFTGNSYIHNAGMSELTLNGCDVNVNVPTNVNNGRAAFVSLSSSETTSGIKLDIQNCTFEVTSTADSFAAAIFGWAYVADGSIISGNTFGSETNPYRFIAVKLMNFVDGATVEISNNTVYGSTDLWYFQAFDLYQNNSRANTYTANFTGNTVIVNETIYTGYFLYFEVDGGVGSGTVYIDSTNTYNGAQVTAEHCDIEDAAGTINFID